MAMCRRLTASFSFASVAAAASSRQPGRVFHRAAGFIISLATGRLTAWLGPSAVRGGGGGLDGALIALGGPDAEMCPLEGREMTAMADMGAGLEGGPESDSSGSVRGACCPAGHWADSSIMSRSSSSGGGANDGRGISRLPFDNRDEQVAFEVEGPGQPSSASSSDTICSSSSSLPSSNLPAAAIDDGMEPGDEMASLGFPVMVPPGCPVVRQTLRQGAAFPPAAGRADSSLARLVDITSVRRISFNRAASSSFSFCVALAFLTCAISLALGGASFVK